MYRNYKNGFKAIIYSKAALFAFIGIILRFWEEATVSTFLSDYMKNYTDNPQDKEELWNNRWYPLLVALSSFIGGPFSNITSMFFIGLFNEDNQMAIPYLILMRQFIDIPCLYMIFIHQNNFMMSIIGVYLRSLLSMGTT